MIESVQRLMKLTNEDETVVKFLTTENLFWNFCIVPKFATIDELHKMDFGGALEYTLHTILENGGDTTDMGAFIPDERDFEQFGDELIPIDLGYYVNGSIMAIEPLTEEDKAV